VTGGRTTATKQDDATRHAGDETAASRSPVLGELRIGMMDRVRWVGLFVSGHAASHGLVLRKKKP
jgi:hypothetical protein